MNVYVVIQDSGEYESRFQSVVGVFTDVDEARACEAVDRADREIETWSVGAGCAQQWITLHIAKRFVANVNFDDPAEVQWATDCRDIEVDASTAFDRYDYGSKQELRRSGRTREEAEQRLEEALKDFEPDLTPIPKEFRWAPRYRYVQHFAGPQ